MYLVKYLLRIFAMLGLGIFVELQGFIKHRWYTNIWAIRSSVSEHIIKAIASDKGLELVKEAAGLPGLYYFIHTRHPKRSIHENKKFTLSLFNYKEVLWANQVPVKLHSSKSGSWACGSVAGKTAYSRLFPDPYFIRQWYLHDCRKDKNQLLKDINVIPVWYKYRLFGKGITVAVVDGRADTTHNELKDNYDAELSVSLRTGGNENIISDHATFVAGIFAMRAGNKLCAVGISPLVTFGLIVMRNSNYYANDFDIMEAFLWGINKFDVMVCPWGPTDNGYTIDYISSYLMVAFKDGITQGRQGKGIIYVFPAGNGRINTDNCAYDYTANIIYTITVGNVARSGTPSWESEGCSSILVAGYGGDPWEQFQGPIISTKPKNGCCVGFHAGTSYSSPQITGIVTLMLEANPNLTWRCIQHVLVWTSEVAPLSKNYGWERNKTGLYYHPYFGFGIINALAAVELALALQDKILPALNSCIFQLDTRVPLKFSSNRGLCVKIRINGCQKLPSNVNYIEHIQFIFSIKYSYRGNLRITLTSPAGTLTHLLKTRSKDLSSKGFDQWVIDTTHLWGENPTGEWTLKIFDSSWFITRIGELNYAALVIHGTRDKPFHYTIPRKYYKFKRTDSTLSPKSCQWTWSVLSNMFQNIGS